MPLNRMPLVAEMYEGAARQRQKARRYVGMSGIGNPCELAVWLGFRGVTPAPIDGRACMIFDLGDRVEQAVLKWIEAAGFKVEGRQEDFSDLGGHFRGHCDGIIHGVTQEPHILEIKSAKAAKFEKFQKQGVANTSALYAAQVQCYMAYSGLQRAIWVVMNKDTCELYTERAYFNRQEFERLREKAARIIHAQSPESLQTDKTFCNWCDFRFFCSGNHVQQSRMCWSCAYLAFENCQSKCTHGAHSFDIVDAERVCPDYRFLFSADSF